MRGSKKTLTCAKKVGFSSAEIIWFVESRGKSRDLIRSRYKPQMLKNLLGDSYQQ